MKKLLYFLLILALASCTSSKKSISYGNSGGYFEENTWSVTSYISSNVQGSTSITLTVTPNTDGTHTISWVATKDAGAKLHDIVIGVGTPPVVIDSITYSNNRGLYSWAYWNTNNGSPEYEGSRTLDLRAWYPDWTELRFNAYICWYNTPDSPVDQYSCFDAPVITLSKTASTTAKPGKKKKQ